MQLPVKVAAFFFIHPYPEGIFDYLTDIHLNRGGAENV